MEEKEEGTLEVAFVGRPEPTARVRRLGSLAVCWTGATCWHSLLSVCFHQVLLSASGGGRAPNSLSARHSAVLALSSFIPFSSLVLFSRSQSHESRPERKSLESMVHLSVVTAHIRKLKLYTLHLFTLKCVSPERQIFSVGVVHHRERVIVRTELQLYVP